MRRPTGSPRTCPIGSTFPSASRRWRRRGSSRSKDRASRCRGRFARHPALAQARGRRANYINRVSPLTPHDREILILRIGWDCQAVYEWAKHVGTVGRARYHGVDPRAVALGPNAPGADGFNATLLQVVDELYQNAIVSDETWRALTAEYDTVEAMSAVYTPSSYRATSMSLNAYGVQLEPGDESFPDVPLR